MFIFSIKKWKNPIGKYILQSLKVLYRETLKSLFTVPHVNSTKSIIAGMEIYWETYAAEKKNFRNNTGNIYIVSKQWQSGILKVKNKPIIGLGD